MTKILWVSTQQMTNAQLIELQRVFGAEGEVEVKNYNEPVSDWQDVVKAGEDCDVFAINFSTYILPADEDFDNVEKVVIQPDEDHPPRWQQILGIETQRIYTLCPL